MRFMLQKNRFKLFNIGLIFLLFANCLVSVSCQTKEERTTAVLKQCQAFLDQDNLQAATDCYGKAVLDNPESGGDISQAGKVAVFKKCVDYKHKKNFKNSIVCFEGFSELEPNMANNYFQIADSYYNYFQEDRKKNGKPDLELLERAEEAVKTGIKIKNEDAGAHSLYGQILSAKGNKENSLTEHQTATILSPKTHIFWIYYAMAQEDLGEDEEALKSCQQALTLKPDDPLTLSLIGKLYVKIGKQDEAIGTFEKLLKIQPDYDEEVTRKLNELKRLRDEKKPKAKAIGRP